MTMDYLSVLLTSSPLFQAQLKPLKPSTSKPSHPLTNSELSSHSHHTYFPCTWKIHLPHKTHVPNPPNIQTLQLSNVPLFSKSKLSLSIIQLFTALPCFASEPLVLSSTEQVSNKIDLEAIVVSIDDFLNRNPFFASGCAFIWLVVIPFTEHYLSKCKYIYAIDAYRKLKDDPSAQLLDIRDGKSVRALKSPNLKFLDKETVRIEFSEGNEDGFVKNVLENFQDPASTVLCIMDNSDDKSLEVAQLLYKNGFKEAYAIKGGARGPKGWLVIQETLLPPAVHMYRRKKRKASKDAMVNGKAIRGNEDSFADTSPAITHSDVGYQNGHLMNSSASSAARKICSTISSPYPNYPDMKPPSSPTPAQPKH